MNHASKIGFVETPSSIARLMISLSNVSKDALVLDTGCGKGVFLSELEKEGFRNCYGIEIDKEFYQMCHERFSKKLK